MITAPDKKITYDKKIDKIIIKFPWDPGLVERMRNVPTAMWDITLKQWEINPDYIDYVLFNFPSFTIDWTTEPIRDEYFRRDKELNEASAKALQNVIPFLDKPFGNITLYAHQKDGIKSIIQLKRCILSDDLGLGKTYQALISAHYFDKPIYVIAPVSLHDMWNFEAVKLGYKVTMISSSNIGNPPTGDFSVIVDEAHYFQNLNSNRTEAFLNFVGKAGMTVLITGTPLKNGRPSNIFPLLTAIRHPLSYNKSSFEINYCGVKRSQGVAKNIRGATNLQDLHNRISDVIIRRSKLECLNLPEFSRYIQVADMTEEGQKSFDEVFNRLRQVYLQRISEGIISSNQDALVMLTQLRHSGSFGKIPTALKLMEEIREEGNKSIVFSAFKDSAAALHEKASISGKSGLLTSDTSLKERSRLLEAYQRGELDYLVCTFGTGGLGLTMTAGNYVILLDRPWTSGDAEQAEGRAHRIGQNKNVTSIWLQNTIVDSQIDHLLLMKQRNINEVLLGTRDSFEYEVVDLRGEAKEIVRNIFV